MRSRSSRRDSSGRRTTRASQLAKSGSSPPSTDPRVRPPALAVGLAADRPVERRRGVAAVGGERLDHGLLVEVEPAASSRDPGLAPELLEQIGPGLVDRLLRLLDPARRAYRPAAVAELLAQGTEDARHGVGQEVVAVLGLERPDHADQGEPGLLDEVVQRQPAGGVPLREGVRHAEVQRDDVVEQPCPLLRVVARRRAPRRGPSSGPSACGRRSRRAGKWECEGSSRASECSCRTGVESGRAL